MKGIIRYKITIADQPDVFTVRQVGKTTYVDLKNNMGIEFCLPYKTRDVIQYLKEGRWKKVKSKREALKSPNLFSLDDI